MAARKTMKPTVGYSVGIETVGDGWRGHEQQMDDLSEIIHGLRGMGGIVSWGGLAGGPGVRLTVDVRSPVEAAETALGIFEQALAKAGIAPHPVARIDVETEAYLEAELNQPPDEFVGVAEIARILGVSKQRVHELRRRRDFPRPLAELAAGPVWNRTWLNRFIEGWERKPGRPRTRSASAARSPRSSLMSGTGRGPGGSVADVPDEDLMAGFGEP